jgi:hypothetical protein
MNAGGSPPSASDVIERRLAMAAQAVRERDLCTQQHRQLSAREQAAAAELAVARKVYAGAERDVSRLEHLSLTRVLAALHGAREDTLAREQAEVEAARYRYAEAQQRLDGVRAEQARLEDRLAELAEVRDRLGTAANWSTFDTYFNHGMVANAIKHDLLQ